jgi:hypothetical protein
METIKRSGGTTVLQHPDDAGFPPLPHALVETPRIAMRTLEERRNVLLHMSQSEIGKGNRRWATMQEEPCRGDESTYRAAPGTHGKINPHRRRTVGRGKLSAVIYKREPLVSESYLYIHNAVGEGQELNQKLLQPI